MLDKKKWLAGLAVVAVLGSAATPMLASAHSTEDGDRTALSVKAGGKVRASGALATALGVEPAALEAAVKAALETTPKPEGENRKDPAAREAYQDALLANIATGLGITVEQWQAAIESLKSAKDDDGEHEGKHEKVLGRKLADALGITSDALAAAVQAARAAVTPLTDEQKADPAAREAHRTALEAAIAQELGITVEAFDAAQAAVKAEALAKKDERREAHEAKAAEHFRHLLGRLVAAEIITQAQADEILTQYNLGGEAKEQVIQRLRTLLQEQKVGKRDGQREERRERKDAKREQRSGFERLDGLKQHRNHQD